MNLVTKTPSTFLADPADLPLLHAQRVAELGCTLVVAPHPDDETLGCGGLMALLRQAGLPVHLMVMSDGTRSHPNSRRFPAPGLRDLRERETLAALAMLGIAEDFATFLRFPDGDVPTPISSRFGDAVSLCRAYCAAVAPQTVLLPWRRDPHRDHRATHQVMMAALAQMQPMPRVLEYPIWLWMLAADGDDPLVDEVCAWRLDTSQVMQQKKAAIAAYRSQTTNLIDDDPDGFRLLPEHLVYFTQPWEIFFEAAGMPPVLAPEWKGATADV